MIVLDTDIVTLLSYGRTALGHGLLTVPEASTAGLLIGRCRRPSVGSGGQGPETLPQRARSCKRVACRRLAHKRAACGYALSANS